MTSVAVGVPTWNGADYLEECVRSLLDGERVPDQIVIADNSSTDDTRRIGEGLAAADPIVELITHEQNIGAAANFNHLVQVCEADLFAWAPHDDRWSSSLLNDQLEAFRQPDVAVAYGTTAYIDAEGNDDGCPQAAIWSDSGDPRQRIRDLFADPQRSHLHVCTPVLGLMRRDVLLDTELIRPFGGSDKILIVEMALRGRLAPVDAVFERRRHPQSSVVANRDDQARRRWFDPAAKGPPMPTTRLIKGFLGAIKAAPLPAATRAVIAADVLRWSLGERRPRLVGGELLDGTKWGATRLVRRSTKRGP